MNTCQYNYFIIFSYFSKKQMIEESEEDFLTFLSVDKRDIEKLEEKHLNYVKTKPVTAFKNNDAIKSAQRALIDAILNPAPHFPVDDNLEDIILDDGIIVDADHVPNDVRLHVNNFIGEKINDGDKESDNASVINDDDDLLLPGLEDNPGQGALDYDSLDDEGYESHFPSNKQTGLDNSNRLRFCLANRFDNEEISKEEIRRRLHSLRSIPSSDSLKGGKEESDEDEDIPEITILDKDEKTEGCQLDGIILNSGGYHVDEAED